MIDNILTLANDSVGNPDLVQCIESTLTITGSFLPYRNGDYFCQIELSLNQYSLQPSRSIQLGPIAGEHCPSGILFVTDLYSCAVNMSVSTVDASATSSTNAPNSGEEDAYSGMHEDLIITQLSKEPSALVVFPPINWHHTKLALCSNV